MSVPTPRGYRKLRLSHNFDSAEHGRCVLELVEDESSERLFWLLTESPNGHGIPGTVYALPAAHRCFGTPLDPLAPDSRHRCPAT